MILKRAIDRTKANELRIDHFDKVRGKNREIKFRGRLGREVKPFVTFTVVEVSRALTARRFNCLCVLIQIEIYSLPLYRFSPLLSFIFSPLPHPFPPLPTFFSYKLTHERKKNLKISRERENRGNPTTIFFFSPNFERFHDISPFPPDIRGRRIDGSYNF